MKKLIGIKAYVKPKPLNLVWSQERERYLFIYFSREKQVGVMEVNSILSFGLL